MICPVIPHLCPAYEYFVASGAQGAHTGPVRGLLFVSLCIALSAGLCAQVFSSGGTIEGSVTDSTGAGIPSATVTILNRVSNYRQEIKSDDDTR